MASVTLFGLRFEFGFRFGATPSQRLRVDLDQSPLSAQGSRISLRPKRILVVDDDRVILKTAGMKLLAAGYDVKAVEGCSEAIAAVDKFKPELILLDVNFPPDVLSGGTTAWDGFKLMGWLQNLKSAKQMRFIIISSDSRETLEKHGLAAAIFQKPLDYDYLLETIARELTSAGGYHAEG